MPNLAEANLLSARPTNNLGICCSNSCLSSAWSARDFVFPGGALIKLSIRFDVLCYGENKKGTRHTVARATRRSCQEAICNSFADSGYQQSSALLPFSSVN